MNRPIRGFKQFTLQIDPELHKQIRIRAAENNTTMRAIIIEATQNALAATPHPTPKAQQ